MRTSEVYCEWRRSVFHQTEGVGTPVTSQTNVRFPPSCAFVLDARTVTSGTPAKQDSYERLV